MSKQPIVAMALAVLVVVGDATAAGVETVLQNCLDTVSSATAVVIIMAAAARADVKLKETIVWDRVR